MVPLYRLSAMFRILAPSFGRNDFLTMEKAERLEAWRQVQVMTLSNF